MNLHTSDYSSVCRFGLVRGLFHLCSLFLSVNCNTATDYLVAFAGVWARRAISRPPRLLQQYSSIRAVVWCSSFLSKMAEPAAPMQSNATICPDFREFLEKVDEVPCSDLSTRIQAVCNFLALKEHKVYSELDLSGSAMNEFTQGGLPIR